MQQSSIDGPGGGESGGLAQVTGRISCALVALFMSLLIGNEPALARPDGEAIKRGVGVVIANVLTAWGNADARTIAAQYEPEGDFVAPTGEHAVGGSAIEAFYKTVFASGYAGSRATARIIRSRALSPTVELIDGSWTIEPTPESKITEHEAGLFFAVLRRHNGRWWIAALREQTSAQALRDL